jgi:hypothetical protein
MRDASTSDVGVDEEVVGQQAPTDKRHTFNVA